MVSARIETYKTVSSVAMGQWNAYTIFVRDCGLLDGNHPYFDIKSCDILFIEINEEYKDNQGNESTPNTVHSFMAFEFIASIVKIAISVCNQVALNQTKAIEAKSAMVAEAVHSLWYEHIVASIPKVTNRPEEKG